MKTSLRHQRRGSRGGVIVEFAVLLPLMVTFLAAPLLLGRIFWHYTVMEKAVHDAARVLAGASLVEIRAPGAGGTDVPMAAVTRAIVQEEIAELNPGLYAPYIDIQCDGAGCSGFTTPNRITVRATVPIDNLFFGGITSIFAGEVFLEAVATMNYVGT